MAKETLRRVETWLRTSEVCPLCGHPSLADWSGTTVSPVGSHRLTVSVTSFRCTRGCAPDPDQLSYAFPDRSLD